MQFHKTPYQQRGHAIPQTMQLYKTAHHQKGIIYIVRKQVSAGFDRKYSIINDAVCKLGKHQAYIQSDHVTSCACSFRQVSTGNMTSSEKAAMRMINVQFILLNCINVNRY